MKFKLNWGTWIAISLVLFVLFIIYLFTTSTTGTSDYLQDDDYYEKGLQYQDHIELEKNLMPYKDDVKVVEVNGVLKIQLPKAIDLDTVKMHLYCPSDGNLDQRKIISSQFDSTNSAMLDVADLKKGLWRVKLNFNDQSGVGYYYEQAITR